MDMNPFTSELCSDGPRDYVLHPATDSPDFHLQVNGRTLSICLLKLIQFFCF